MGDVINAKKLFKKFSGHELDQAFDVDMLAPDGATIFAFGVLSAFESQSGEWMEFDDSPPLLCANADGSQLYIYSEDVGAELPYGGISLAAVEYATYRDHEYDLYRHEFDANDPPVLKSGPDGDLIIDGGVYYFSERGIVD